MMNLQRAKLNFIVNTFIPFTWILYYHVIYPFSFTEILNCFFNHLKNILHSLILFPLQLSCTAPRFCPYLFSFVTLYSNYLFSCLPPFQSNDRPEDCLPFFICWYSTPVHEEKAEA